jgi:hypothetical protein
MGAHRGALAPKGGQKHGAAVAAGGNSPVTRSSAVDSVQKPGGGAAPRGWVLLKWREGVKEVLTAVAN